MKRIAPLILVAVAALIAVFLVDRHRDSATAYTGSKDAWDAYTEGESLLQSFRYAEADSMLRKAVELDPGLAMAHVALGELSYRIGNRNEGKHHYALADSLALLVDDPQGCLLLQVRLANARISRFHSQRDSLLAEAKASCPDHLIVLLTEAMSAAVAGDLVRAEELYQHILAINPNFAGAYNFLGYLYLEQGKYDEAETAMRRYAFVAPDLANPHDSLGEVLMTVGRYEEALEQFRSAIDKQPFFYHSQINIGWVYFARGEIDRALTLLDRVHDSLAGTATARNLEANIIWHLFWHRLNDDIVPYADRFLATYDDDHDAKSRRSQVEIIRLLSLDQPVAAVALVDSLQASVEAADWYDVDVVSTIAVQAGAQRFRGLAAEQVGAHEDAARLFQETLTLLQNSPPRYQLHDRVHLAYNLIPLRAYDEARIQIRAALSVNPRLLEGILVAASIEAAAGNETEALRLLDTLDRTLEKADPDFPVVLEARQLREQLPDPGQI